MQPKLGRDKEGAPSWVDTTESSRPCHACLPYEARVVEEEVNKRRYSWKGPGLCLCCGVSEAGFASCSFSTHHAKEVQAHVPRTVRSSDLSRDPKREEVPSTTQNGSQAHDAWSLWDNEP